MSRYVTINRQGMDDFLKSEKGWIRNITGNEYVYDFHLKKYPIIIKVNSSIRVDTDRARNKGADAIRIFAVKKEGLNPDDKIIGGLVKATRVNRMDNWRKHLRTAVENKIKTSKIVYDKMRKNEESKS